MAERFLPGVPGELIEEDHRRAGGKQIKKNKNGKARIDSPRSSAALVANTLGFFRDRVDALPHLPGCSDVKWPARSLRFEQGVDLPWSPNGGPSAELDVLITTLSAVIGVEAKRFEQFSTPSVSFSPRQYWRNWGDCMKGYEKIRDVLCDNKQFYVSLKADQLVKHAFALRTQVSPDGHYEGLKPILFYLFAEPAYWPSDSHSERIAIDDNANAVHQEEIAHFAHCVEGDEVRFVACSYRELLATWEQSDNPDIREHTRAVVRRFSP